MYKLIFSTAMCVLSSIGASEYLLVSKATFNDVSTRLIESNYRIRAVHNLDDLKDGNLMIEIEFDVELSAIRNGKKVI